MAFFTVFIWFVWLVEHSLFVILWAAALQLLWRCSHALFSRYLRDDTGGLVRVLSAIVTLSLLFELINQYQLERAAQSAAIVRGSPASCSGYTWWDSLRTIWTTTDVCERHFELTTTSVLWKLNPLRVCLSLWFAIAALAVRQLTATCGVAVVEFVNTVPLVYQFPAVILVLIVAVFGMLIWNGYELALAWRFVVARPAVNLGIQSAGAANASLVERKNRQIFVVNESLQKGHHKC